LIRYLVVDYNTGEVEVDVGVPIEAPTLPADDRVYPAQIPAGTFATVIHRGSYDALVKTTAALLDWGKEKNVKWQVAEERKVTRWNARVEHYQVGRPMSRIPKTGRPRSRSLSRQAMRSGISAMPPYLARRLTSRSTPDASPAALARRPLAAVSFVR